MRILITGGAGFVGHHFVEHFLRNTDWDIVVLDKLNYASNGVDRLRDIKAFDDKRVLTLATDFTQPLSDGVKQEIGKVDYIFHLGAESHVDNSITNPEPFVMSNVVGTMHMLNFAKELKDTLKCFFYFGTDEVFGPAPDGYDYKEDDRHNPTNPYSAAKSGGEMLVKAYRNTYKLPCVITRSMNIFGERQHPEKFIIKAINCVLTGEKLPIHSYPDKSRAGSRFYIHARNVADGYLHLVNLIENNRELLDGKKHDGLEDGVIGQDFHITGQKELDNLTLAKLIEQYVKEFKPDAVGLNYELTDFHSSRPGHDLRYSLSGEKLKRYGWVPPMSVEESLRRTVKWSLENDKWLKI